MPSVMKCSVKTGVGAWETVSEVNDKSFHFEVIPGVKLMFSPTGVCPVNSMETIRLILNSQDGQLTT